MSLFRLLTHPFWKRSVSATDFADLIYQLGLYLEAGVNQIEALRIIQSGTTTPALKVLLSKIELSLNAGGNLADGLALQPRLFKPFMAEMVRSAGPKALPGVLLSLGEFLESIHFDTKKIKSAVAYPLVVIVIAVMIVSLLMVFVVPVFEQMFADFGSRLPGPTQILIDASRFLRYNLPYLVIVVAVLFFGNRFADRKFTFVNRFWSYTIRRAIPLWGRFSILMHSVAFLRTVTFMMTAGRSLTKSLEAAAETMNKPFYQRAVAGINDEQTRGHSLAEAVKNSAAFPAQIISAAAVAESKPDTLIPLFSRLGDRYHGQIQNLAGNMSSLIEPILVVALGIIIGSMVVAMYLPIFQVAGAV